MQTSRPPRWIPASLLLTVFLGGSARGDSPDPRFPPVSELPSSPALPDPLTYFRGGRVATGAEWIEKRRPELKTLFQHYMYGYMPPPPARLDARVERVRPDSLRGKATRKEVAVTLGPAAPTMHILLFVPNGRAAPAPVFLGLNFCGNHTVVGEADLPLPGGWMPSRCPGVVENHASEAGRGGEIEVWDVEGTIDAGYALATVYHGNIDPDRPDFTDGVHPHYLKPGQEKPGQHDWGTIAAWAWGLHRAVDYLATDPDLDPKRIAVFGHSRNGKTALLAAAFDERIALCIPHQAGCGGTAPSRGRIGESVKQINAGFPHWFNDEFTQFNEQVDRLPFDQHCLIALVAPRPVLLTNAVEDSWANPEGQFEMLRAADKVYRFLGVEGLAANSMPEPGKLVESRLGYYIRPGKHSTTPGDWKVFRAFADRHLRPER